MAEELQVIGREVNRFEGRDKVTGRARYAADRVFPGMVHAYGVYSTIAAGKIERIDTAEAERAAGVVAVFHHGRFPRVFRSPNDMEEDNRVGEVRPPFEDDRVYYSGQFVAVVVAETFEQARSAARRVRIVYAEEKPALTLDEGIRKNGPKTKEDSPDVQRGDPEAAWNRAPVKVEATYTMPVEVHNPMEMHASVAIWIGDRLDAYESTQWVVGQRKALAKILGIPPEQVTVHSEYIGGGFGGKLFLWPHTVIAAVAARELRRPVKLVVDRQHEFTTVGHRPANAQHLKLAAERDGTLLDVEHHTQAHTSLVHDFLEECGSNTKTSYRCPNMAITHRMVPLNVGTPVSMRAPGAASGLFALECAMDELAVALRMDPVELRLKNWPDVDPDKNRPWSSNRQRECIETVRERFGWSRRNPIPGAMRDGPEFVGWGFANATWPAHRRSATTRVAFFADGTVKVSCATQDIGTGTYTVAAQVLAEVAELPLERVRVAIGDSRLPEGPISGGSMVTATIVPAIAEAAKKALKNLVKTVAKHGVFAGDSESDLQYVRGDIVSGESGRRVPFEKALADARVGSVDAESSSKPGEESRKFTFKSFGAHAVEVRWDPGLARLRVSRVVSAFDCGRIINRKTATNQIYGSLLMGIGAALLEKSVYDRRDGHVVTDNIADYLVPVHADTPQMDVVFIEGADPHIGEFGAKGVGEIGITGIVGAVANAVYHATGKRVRDLPIRVEKLL